ncbi:MAG: hypothetical protein ACLSB9_31070 [Hydrogeniiclostridium mannosilyticum]
MKRRFAMRSTCFWRGQNLNDKPARTGNCNPDGPAQESRLVNHLLYAAPVRRGQNVEVIEDIIPLSTFRCA